MPAAHFYSAEGPGNGELPRNFLHFGRSVRHSLGLDGWWFELTISDLNAGDFALAMWLHGLTRRMGWLDK